MDQVLGGLVFVNGVDIWTQYGVFLAEEKKGGKDNLTAIMTPSKTKKHVAVNIREENGEKHSSKLTVVNEPRNVTLCFALYAETQARWLSQFDAFITFLKTGNNGWLNFSFPQLNRTLRMHYQSSTIKPLTSVWNEGAQAARFKVEFREPNPTI